MMDRYNHCMILRITKGRATIYILYIQVYYTASIEPIWRVVNAYTSESIFIVTTIIPILIYSII